MNLARRNAFFVFFLLTLVVLANEPIRRLIVLSGDGDNSHSSYILLIPFISLLLIVLDRKRVFQNVSNSLLPGVAVCIAGAVLYYVARTYGVQFGENDYVSIATLSLILFVLGGFLSVYGAAAFKAARFSLMFLILTVPIPSHILQQMVVFLQRGSAELVSMLFVLVRTPFYRNDFVFVLPSLSIEVAEQCSGIRSTIGMFVVTLLAAHLLLRYKWTKTALLIAVIPVSLFKNAVRIVTLTLLAVHYDMGFLTGNLHSEGGILFMLGGLGLMYPILALLVKSEQKYSGSGVQS